jgi:hypothetical protein
MPATAITAARRRRIPRAVLIGGPIFIVGVVVALLFVAQIQDSNAGCGSVDPTDPANYSSITILNDTSNPVLVGDCPSDYCQTNVPPVRLGAGGELSDHAACGSTGSAMTSWRVTRANGSTIGFIAVDTPKSTNGLLFKVSNASRSRTAPTPPG